MTTRLIQGVSVAWVMLCLSCAMLPSAVDEKPGDANLSIAIDRLLERVPARNAGDEQRISRELVALGPDGILELCGRLKSPGTGDDSNIRFTVHALVRHASRHGADV